MSACGGFGTSIAFILVLYILLVIVVGGVFI
ncbi:sporulation protein YjcZ [Paenibacillus aurantius]|uniref:Sporulation protein YjcZ n=1 Tax=Paenibacillus aurantius TaxID=2918900 RepID=A0AA96REM2_9BACL|nr:sporulation protein YjcZ [Paenibacillus aurantius]WNQ12610.1 sporulation protein YjcZ [Paenibacillus aurantius]